MMEHQAYSKSIGVCHGCGGMPKGGVVIFSDTTGEHGVGTPLCYQCLKVVSEFVENLGTSEASDEPSDPDEDSVSFIWRGG